MINLDSVRGFWRNLEIQDGRPIWPTLTQFPCHVTSSTHDVDLKGNNFRRTIHLQRFIAVAFIFSELDTTYIKLVKVTEYRFRNSNPGMYICLYRASQ